MLTESGLDKKFWAEATATACYQINRSPSSAINFKTKEYTWTGRPPKIAHLKPFGCIGYAHLNQGKLDFEAMKAIFLGYPKGVKGYRLWLINEMKVIISRDVISMKMFSLRLTCRSQYTPRILTISSSRWKMED